MSNFPPLVPTFDDEPEQIALLDYLALAGGDMAGPINMNQHDVQNIGDWWSADWDGAIPIDLSAGADATAGLGVAFDASAGAIQALSFYGAISPPTGGITLFGGAAAPSGWVLCDGSSYDTTAFAPLFAVIAYTYGGSGANFNVPDMRDRFVIGKSGTIALGATGGSFNHDHTIAHTHTTPNHSHSVTGSVSSDSHSHGDSLSTGSDSHSHGDTFSLGQSSINTTRDAGGAVLVARNTHSHVISGSVSSDGHNHSVTGSVSSDSHSHGDTFGTGNASPTTDGSSAANSGTNNPPYLGLNYIIKQ